MEEFAVSKRNGRGNTHINSTAFFALMNKVGTESDWEPYLQGYKRDSYYADGSESHVYFDLKGNVTDVIIETVGIMTQIYNNETYISESNNINVYSSSSAQGNAGNSFANAIGNKPVYSNQQLTQMQGVIDNNPHNSAGYDWMDDYSFTTISKRTLITASHSDPQRLTTCWDHIHEDWKYENTTTTLYRGHSNSANYENIAWINFTNAPASLNANLQKQVLTQVQQIFTNSGVNIIIATSNRSDHKTGQNVDFDGIENAIGSGDFGWTVSEISDYRSSTIVNNKTVIDNDFGFGGTLQSKTLKYANVIAHEILHGFYQRALLKLAVKSPIALNAGGHTISGKVNLLSSGAERHSIGVKNGGTSALDDDWINNAANIILPDMIKIINKYLLKSK